MIKPWNDRYLAATDGKHDSAWARKAGDKGGGGVPGGKETRYSTTTRVKTEDFVRFRCYKTRYKALQEVLQRRQEKIKDAAFSLFLFVQNRRGQSRDVIPNAFNGTRPAHRPCGKAFVHNCLGLRQHSSIVIGVTTPGRARLQSGGSPSASPPRASGPAPAASGRLG